MNELTIERNFLRHTLATLAYRAGNAIRAAPDFFPSLNLSQTSRTPLEILAHMGDLFDWALAMAEGRDVERKIISRTWDEEVSRFFRLLQQFDDRLADPKDLGFPEERLFQGPVADALCHVGQLAILRGLAKAPVRGENYFNAPIQQGKVGLDQGISQSEFE